MAAYPPAGHRADQARCSRLTLVRCKFRMRLANWLVLCLNLLIMVGGVLPPNICVVADARSPCMEFENQGPAARCAPGGSNPRGAPGVALSNLVGKPVAGDVGDAAGLGKSFSIDMQMNPGFDTEDLFFTHSSGR